MKYTTTTNGAVSNSTSVTLDNNQVATAKVNGAISSTTALVVDNNTGVIRAGMLVTGTGISGTPTVEAVTNNQKTITLSTAQSLSNNVVIINHVGILADLYKYAKYVTKYLLVKIT